MNNIPPPKIFHFSRMSRVGAFLILFLLISGLCSAQYFERIYPGLNLGYIGSIDNTIDSGYIICGTQDGGFLMKLKANGDSEWISRDTGNLQSSAAVIQDATGKFIVAGSGSSQLFNSEAVIATYDAAGDPISDFNIPPVDGWGTWGTTIVRSEDRTLSHYCYYVDGYTADNSYILDNMDKIAGDMTYVGMNSISMDNNGNYYVAANMEFDMDSLFNWRNNVLILSSNHFPRTEYFFDTDISSAAITSDGSVLLAGLYDSLGTKYLRLMKFNSAANLLWDTFLDDSDLFSVNQIAQTPDGGFAILCSADNGINIHIAFIKIDAAGNQLWKQEYYGSGTALPRNFRLLPDGFVILGNSGGDPYLIRTDSMGRTNSTSIAGSQTENNALIIYPNPTNGNIHFDFSNQQNKNQQLSVLDITGREVFQTQLKEGDLTLDLSFLAKGVYHFRLSTAEGIGQSSTLVIQ